RSPTTMNLDLGVYYPIKVGEGKELRFSGDWFNVFNSQRAVTLDQTFTINSGVGSGATAVPPVPNPFYGSALLSIRCSCCVVFGCCPSWYWRRETVERQRATVVSTRFRVTSTFLRAVALTVKSSS